jgi:hypothetical protein
MNKILIFEHLNFSFQSNNLFKSLNVPKVLKKVKKYNFKLKNEQKSNIIESIPFYHNKNTKSLKVPKVLYSKLRILKIDKKIALKEILKLLFLTILNN